MRYKNTDAVPVKEREKEYIEREALVDILNTKADMALGTPKEVFHAAAKMVNVIPTADVVEVETIKAWLYEIAINNAYCVIDGDFSDACEEITNRLDGLRLFAKERREK